MIIKDIRQHKRSVAFLYALLDERDPIANISHRRMPSMAEHRAFVGAYGEPYQYWGIVEVEYVPVGAVYLTRRDEIGIAILKRYQGRGYGPQAVKLLMQMFGDRDYLANIAPGNVKSQGMFEALGFEMCQVTMRRRGAGDENGQD